MTALRGIRVLEATTAVAGPVAGHILGDMGAEVIKVEEVRARARVANAPPAREGAPDRPYNRVATWNELNRSKKHLPLNLASEDGKAIFLRLVEQADIVIENFSPRVMPNLGLDYAALSAVNPRVVMISMPAFGADGPYRTRGSYGPGIDAMSGLSHLTGYPDRGPGKPGNYFCDQNAGLHAAFSALVALRARQKTGRGQHVELAMLEGELQFVGPAVLDYTVNGRVQTRIGNRHAHRAPQGVYPCLGEDQWVALSVSNDTEWAALAGLVAPALRDDSRLLTVSGRLAAHDELDRAISAWTASRTKREAEAALQEVGVSAGAALDASDLFADPQLRHRGSFAWVDHPEVGRFPHTRTAWRSRSGAHGVQAPAPCFGDAVDEVLTGLLGLSPEAVSGLVEAGVTTRAPRPA